MVPLTASARVDFPAPLRPLTTASSPDRTANDTALSAGTSRSGYVKVTDLNSSLTGAGMQHSTAHFKNGSPFDPPHHARYPKLE